jgi:hypothetical protein
MDRQGKVRVALARSSSITTPHVVAYNKMGWSGAPAEMAAKLEPPHVGCYKLRGWSPLMLGAGCGHGLLPALDLKTLQKANVFENLSQFRRGLKVAIPF